MSEANRKRLMDIKLRECNDNRCADCSDTDPEWASYSLGVFLCFACCGIHRALGTHISRTKSLKVDNWEDEQVAVMEDMGNDAAASKYLVCVPACYKRPDKDSPLVLREQWIRAKYERLEFQEVDRQVYLRDEMIGYLMKRGRDDGKFLPRRFELYGRDNKLMYFTKENAKSPKAKLAVDELNCCFVPSKVGNLNGMQISYEIRGHTRNMYIYSENSKDIVDWYTAIRNAKLNRLRIGLPNLAESELVSRLTRDFIIEGWLYKTGPDIKDAWRRRWFTLDGRRLLYSDETMSAFAKGEIYLGNKADDFAVYEGLPPGRSDYLQSFTVRVPQRQYPLAAETFEEREQWMAAIKMVISKPLTAQDSMQLRAAWKSQK